MYTRNALRPCGQNLYLNGDIYLLNWGGAKRCLNDNDRLLNVRKTTRRTAFYTARATADDGLDLAWRVAHRNTLWYSLALMPRRVEHTCESHIHTYMLATNTHSQIAENP